MFFLLYDFLLVILLSCFLLLFYLFRFHSSYVAIYLYGGCFRMFFMFFLYFMFYFHVSMFRVICLFSVYDAIRFCFCFLMYLNNVFIAFASIR